MQHFKAMIFDIERSSYVDGPGIRTSVFFKGCNLHCAWCHNPESQNPQKEMLFYKNRCIGCLKCKEKCVYNLEKCNFCGKCTIFCPKDARKICGKEYTVEEVMKEVLKDIQEGTFARNWLLENQVNRPYFNAKKRIESETLIEETGSKLRSLMSWLKK